MNITISQKAKELGADKESVLSEEQANKKYLWYSNEIIQNKLIQFMQKREVTLMSNNIQNYCIRGFNILKKDFLNYLFNFYRFSDRDYNLYISVAHYTHIPFFTMALKERSKFTSEWFNNQSQNNIFNYTLLLDFDSHGNFIDMKLEVLKILKLLIKEKVSFFIIPSGHNFQIHIDNTLYNYEEIFTITESLKMKYNLKTLCMAGIGTPNKLMKCPYSIVGNIALIPLSLDMIKNFMEWNYSKVFDSNNILKTKSDYFKYTHHINYLNDEISKQSLTNFVNKYKLL